jgi:CHAT domain-containing protein
LRRAIEVADLARNRTFREQIDSWRRTDGAEATPVAFDWDSNLPRIAGGQTTVLIYHLDSPQLLGNAGISANAEVAPIGGGHLFALFSQGQEIRYYRLRRVDPATQTVGALSREVAADLVRRHIQWIETPDASTEWGRAQQRSLTECLLPSDLRERIQLSPQSAGGADFGENAEAVKHLLIVADGALHQLPFESLLLPEVKNAVDLKIHYVLDDMPPIRYGPSLSVLAGITARSNTEGEGSLLTVGDPAYPAAALQKELPTWNELLRQMPTDNGGFVRLASSEQECDSIYNSFSELPAEHRTRLVQASATEAAVRKHICDSRVVHIAAHGCVDYQNDNLFGALVFAPGADANDPRDDGLMQLREIYALDLHHCDLAVLSACQTYVGAERPLEAGTSMARAFLEQGASRVVCSQWSTDDRATTILMKSFFDDLRIARQSGKEIDYDAALLNAKRALRQDPELGVLPKYWASFVLVGGQYTSDGLLASNSCCPCPPPWLIMPDRR